MRNIVRFFYLLPVCFFCIISIGCSSVVQKPINRLVSSEESCSEYIADIENKAFAQTLAELSSYNGKNRGEVFNEVYNAKILQLTSTERYKSCLKESQESLKNHPWLIQENWGAFKTLVSLAKIYWFAALSWAVVIAQE